MYAYSLRDRTHAAHTLEDDVPAEVKQRRLQEIIACFRSNVQLRNEREELGRLRLVLVEGPSSKSSSTKPTLTGRTDGNKRCVFDAVALPRGGTTEIPQEGDYAVVKITEIRGTTLGSELVAFSSITDFFLQQEKTTGYI
jgi:tRNA A37 methylthiotransferase MiaB